MESVDGKSVELCRGGRERDDRKRERSALVLNIRGGRYSVCCGKEKIPTDVTRGGIKVGLKEGSK